MSTIKKFRVWDSDFKKMLLLNDAKFVNGVLIGAKGIHWDSKVIVQQFTGLKDKNGKEIYENDIVEVEDYGTGRVIFDEAMFQYVPIESDGWEIESGVTCKALYPIIDQEVTVIGNIYETKELLNQLN